MCLPQLGWRCSWRLPQKLATLERLRLAPPTAFYQTRSVVVVVAVVTDVCRCFYCHSTDMWQSLVASCVVLIFYCHGYSRCYCYCCCYCCCCYSRYYCYCFCCCCRRLSVMPKNAFTNCFTTHFSCNAGIVLLLRLLLCGIQQCTRRDFRLLFFYYIVFFEFFAFATTLGSSLLQRLSSNFSRLLQLKRKSVE